MASGYTTFQRVEKAPSEAREELKPCKEDLLNVFEELLNALSRIEEAIKKL